MKSLLAAKNRFSVANSFSEVLKLNFAIHLIMPAILAIGFSLRLIGLSVGLPDSLDPREVLIAQDVLNLIHFTAPPQIYNWPGTAWFYLIAGVGKVLLLGGLALTESRVILLARGVNTLFSTATLWFTYCIGHQCYSRTVGQIAAGFLAVAMLHATNESRFALVDIPATFCVTLFLWRVMRARSGTAVLTFQTAVWLGVILGIGFAVKFTTIFVGFALLCFMGSERFWRRLAALIGVSALTFTLLCPYWLIELVLPEWDFFFADVWYEATHYHRGHFGLVATGDSGWLQRFLYLWTLLKWGMGAPLAFLVTFAVVWSGLSIVKKSRILLPTANSRRFPTALFSEGPLLAIVIPYLLFIGVHKVKFARHLLILYPALTVFGAAMLARVPSTVHTFFKFARRNSAQRAESVPKACNPFQKWVGIAVGSIVMLYSFVYTAAFATVLLAPPTGVAASEWIATHVRQEDAISVAPELLFDWLLPKLDRGVTIGEAKWALVLAPDLEVFQKYHANPQSYQDADWYPLGEIALAETLAFYARILGEGSPYRLHETFQRTPQFLGIRISDSGAPFPMRALAHPEVRLYRRRD